MKEKYGYEEERDDPTVKTAVKKGNCPICGEEVVGQPPVCPNHGSEPFEKKDEGGDGAP